MSEKILILLLYYERPILVRNALNSILRANEHCKNWQLAVIDDGSPTPVGPIVEDILKDYLSQVRFYNTDVSPSEKLQTGSTVGKTMNQAIAESDCTCALMLCDDDELVADSLLNITKFFEDHKSAVACYSHIHLYNPAFEKSEIVNNTLFSKRFNSYVKRINPAGKMDASQVAWRTSVNKIGNIWFPPNKTKNLDEEFYHGLVKKYGRIPFSQIVVQYKSFNSCQLKDVHERVVWNGRSLDLEAVRLSTSVSDIMEIVNRYNRQGKEEEAQRIRREGLVLYPENKYLLELPMDKFAPLNMRPYRTPRAVSESIKDLLAEKVVCSLGCGEGDNLVFMSKYAKTAIGVECDPDKVRLARSRGLTVIHGDYRSIDLPLADVYYFWPTVGATDNEFLIDKILKNQDFRGTIIVGGDPGYPPEVPSLERCAALGRLQQVAYDEGPGHRENGVFLLAIIDVSDLRKNVPAVFESNIPHNQFWLTKLFSWILNIFKKREPKPKYCVLTFDDGYRSHHDFVMPLLKEKGMTGTFYVCGGYIARSSASRAPIPVGGYGGGASICEFMTWEEIKSLNSSGFEIGNHLAKHVDMRSKDGKRLLQYASQLDGKLNRLGIPKTETIAYPGFLVNQAVFDFAKAYGFAFGRSGCEKAMAYDKFQGGGFGGCQLPLTDRFNVNCSMIFGKNYGYPQFVRDIVKISSDEPLILCFHDFRADGHAVDITKEEFIRIIDYLSQHGYQFLQMKELGKFFQ